MPEAFRGGFAGGEVWAAELGKKGQKSELFGCCEWELAQRAREEADGLRAVMEQVQRAPHRPRGPGSLTSPQAGVPCCVCARQCREPSGAADLNPQPLGSELTQPFSMEGMAVVWQ